MVGKPMIAGTRLTVELLLRQMTQGISQDELLENYPQLKKEDILAALEYAAERIEEESVYPLHNLVHGQAPAFA